MKKIFTLLVLTAGTISFATAQSYNQKDFGFREDKKISNSRDDHNDFDKGKNMGYNDAYYSMNAKREKMEQINRDFDRRIDNVKHNWFLSRREKERQIDMLQHQRQHELDQLMFYFSKNDDHSRDRNFGHDKHW